MFSEAIPTWQGIRQELESWLDDAAYSQGEAAVHYLDVGQGNCILVQANGHAALIDAGEEDRGAEVAEYLTRQGVERLDYVIASHPHSDHIGGMAEVLRTIPADTVILPELSGPLPVEEYDADSCAALMQAIRETGSRTETAHPGAVYPLGSGTLAVLGASSAFDDWNNRSLAVRFSYGETAFLSTGDMEQEAEEALLASGVGLSANVLAAGHHGSNDASSAGFLQAVGAEYYVIQCGYGNVYGHPAQETLYRMEQQGGAVLRNDVFGTIVLGTDGKTLTLRLQNDPGEYLLTAGVALPDGT